MGPTSRLVPPRHSLSGGLLPLRRREEKGRHYYPKGFLWFGEVMRQSSDMKLALSPPKPRYFQVQARRACDTRLCAQKTLSPCVHVPVVILLVVRGFGAARGKAVSHHTGYAAVGDFTLSSLMAITYSHSTGDRTTESMLSEGWIAQVI